MEHTHLRVSILQMDISLGQPEANYRKAEQMIHEAAKRGTDLIILPEMWNTGYAWDSIDAIADQNGQETDRRIGALAKTYGVTIHAGSIADRRNGVVYNTTYVYDHTGQRLAAYSKMHLFRLMAEEQHLAAGKQAVTFPLKGSLAGTMICYDLRFPELARKLVLAGAEILFLPAQWPHPRLQHWRYLQLARAIENQSYVISCNRVGSSGKDTFFGHSLVINPWGEILLESGEEEGIYHVMLELDMVPKVRQQIPVFADRRPECY